MIGTALFEELVQTVVLTHRVKDHQRANLLLLAAPENGKTTITKAGHCPHVYPIAMISARSVLREVKEHPATEFLLFNDLTAIRALTHSASNALIVMLNQLTQNEHGVVAFAGKEAEHITREIGIIGCLPWTTFKHHRSHWEHFGFISRMVPIAYAYSSDLELKIKDAIDGHHLDAHRPTHKPIKRVPPKVVDIVCTKAHTRNIRLMADARAKELQQRGIRLLKNYHVITRAHAILHGRRQVINDDVDFLHAIDAYVSISACKEL